MPLAFNRSNGFILGQNISITLRDTQGNSFLLADFGHVMEFSATAKDSVLEVTPITNGGLVIHRRIPMGWQGTCTFTRYNGTLDAYVAFNEALFYSQQLQVLLHMLVQVRNIDNSLSQYTFTRSVFHRPTMGNFRADRDVEQSFEWVAQQKIDKSVSSGSGTLNFNNPSAISPGAGGTLYSGGNVNANSGVG